MSNYYAIIDGDGPVFVAGFAGEKRHYTLHIPGWDSLDFPNKKEMTQYIEETGLEEYEVETRREIDPVSHVLHSARLTIDAIMDKIQPSGHTMFLDGGNNFRKAVATIEPYKGRRNKTHRPHYEHEIKDYYQKNYNVKFSNAQESDDECGILATRLAQEGNVVPVIVSADKDLNMIPGWHYNWNKGGDLYYMNEFDSLKVFYTQMLTGDSSDSIRGVPGIGAKTADKLLSDCETEEELWDEVLSAYIEYHTRQLDSLGITDKVDAELHIEHWAMRDALEMGRLLWIRREEGECWFPPGAAREKM